MGDGTQTVTETQTSTAPAIDYSTLDFSQVQTVIVSGITAVAGITIAIIAIKKGWNFIKSALKRA